MWGTGVDAQLSFPLACQRYAGFIPENDVQIFRLAEKSALGPGPQNGNDEDIFARLQFVIPETVLARILNPRAAADKLSVDVDRVHAVDDPKKYHGAAGRQGIGQHDFFAEPDHRRRVRHTERSEGAENLNALPTSIVQPGIRPVFLCSNVIPVK